MIELTDEQCKRLSGDMPVVRNPHTQETYVLVRQELFDRLRDLLTDDTALSKKEVAALVDRAMREYDENDSSLELYQDD